MRTRIQATIHVGYVQFFRIRLLVLSPDEVAKEIESMEKETKGIKEEALRLSWGMRGGVSFNEAMALCMDDRNIIAKIIKENLETTKKSGLPYF